MIIKNLKSWWSQDVIEYYRFIQMQKKKSLSIGGLLDIFLWEINRL